MKTIIIAFFALALSLNSMASDETIGKLNEFDVRNMLTSQGLSSEVVDEFVEALKSSPGSEDRKELQVSAALFTHGGNLAFFVDNNAWNFDAFIKNKRTGELAEIENLFDVYYWNDGIKLELAYKWVWVFLSSDVSLDSLDGSEFGGEIFGRGLAMKTSFGSKLPLAIEGGWVSRNNGPGHAFIVSGLAGITGLKISVSLQSKIGARVVEKKYSFVDLQIMFPKLEFRQNKLLP